MKKNMKKKEIRLLLFFILIALVIIGGLKVYQYINKDKGVKVEVYHANQVIATFYSDENKTYHVEGDYGHMDIEVKDGKWHVAEVECPNHICEQMGWVGPGEFLPITCLPNDIVIVEVSGS